MTPDEMVYHQIFGVGVLKDPVACVRCKAPTRLAVEFAIVEETISGGVLDLGKGEDYICSPLCRTCVDAAIDSLAPLAAEVIV